jgi:hypothetical protein
MSKRIGAVVLALSCAFGSACGSDGGGEDSNDTKREEPQSPGAGSNSGATNAGVKETIVQIGDDVPAGVKERFVAHVSELAPGAKVAGAKDDLSKLGAGSLVVAVGSTWATEQLVPQADVDSLGAEGYVLRTGAIGQATAIVTKGKPRAKLEHGNGGNAFGAFALLEELGMGFLHPLAPATPKAMTVPTGGVTRREEPRWPTRGIQIHTMHPLELTNLLEGWGPAGPTDEAGWNAMLPEWDRFLEWMLANGQNRVHWVLLEAKSWAEFAQSETRRLRLKKLVDRAHAFDIAVGADVPIVLQQQHTFRLITKTGELPDELAQLRSRVDWLMSAGYDYLATENGTTEFTHPDPARMLAWMNELAVHLDTKHGQKPSYVKIHCSTGQQADGYPDPNAPSQDINFNFLPHFADKRLGVMPHTVQHYGLDDPAPTYGNTDFGYMREFLKMEMGKREVAWHPETAYWVSFDIDVPLFLPIYAERRVHDLRLIVSDEKAVNKRMDGQLTFSSGWEWGYWLNDVVTARAAWNPREAAQTDEEATKQILDVAFRPFGPAATTMRDLVVETARLEHRLLVLGEVNGKKPAKIDKRNGQAYLQGWETWDDINELAMAVPGVGTLKRTQPAKLGLVDMRSPLSILGPKYTGEIELLLAAMENELGSLSTKWDAARATVPDHALDLFDDLRDAMKMTALRAKQVHGLYDYVDMRNDSSSAPRLARLATARKALDDAAALVKTRETKYRVPADRIAGWGNNPTSYEFGYLWTVRSLMFWWRDEGKAIDAPSSPCYLNHIAPADVGMGEGAAASGADILRLLLDSPNGTDLAECAAAPAQEPKFPQFNLRTRP